MVQKDTHSRKPTPSAAEATRTKSALDAKFKEWFESNFFDPDGGRSHLPDWLEDDLKLAWDEALTAALGDHSVIVPREPDKRMRDAARVVDGDHGPLEDWLEDEWHMIRGMYKAMISAAHDKGAG
jgi:hypothetical protein